MKSLLLVASAICFLGNGCAAASPPGGVAPAPARRCEIRLSAWCIAEGAYEISRQLANDSIHDRVWSMRGRFRSESKLVIFEPNGCRSGFSNALELTRFERDIEWQDRSWNRMLVRLKSDGSCDLTVLLPPYDSDPMEWAFSDGLLLVRPCIGRRRRPTSAGRWWSNPEAVVPFRRTKKSPACAGLFRCDQAPTQLAGV